MIGPLLRCAMICLGCVLAMPVALAKDPATPERRVALVVGNADYVHGGSLYNPLNDARAMADALRGLGFEVDYRGNLPQREMNRAIALLGQRLPPDGVALFYYAGHGMQIAGKNFLVPVDAEIVSEASAVAEAVDADVLLEQLRHGRLGVLILDACRDNPFERRFRSTVGHGLARMDAPAGVLIAYATAPGKVASDGAGKHSLYTGALLDAMARPGLKVEEVFKQVRVRVMRDSQGEQVPWEASSLLGDFYFLPGEGPAPMAASEASALAPSPTAARTARVDTLPAPGQIFRDCPECPEMTVLPGGRFVRGSPESEKGRFPDEGPARELAVPSFALASRETSIEEFRRFVHATGYRTDAERNIGAQGCFTLDEGAGRWAWRGGSNWRHPGFAQDDSHPVVCLSWNDAHAYVRWLAERTGNPYRLPSEAELEYAARAGTTGARYWGERPDEACLYANVDDVGASRTPTWREKHDCDDHQATTARAGAYVPNAFGLYDLLGNAAEWAGDCWDEASSPPEAATAGDCDGRTYRGGAWSDGPRAVRAAYRGRLAPEARTDFLGLRVARGPR